LFVICATMFATAPIVGAPISRAQCTITGPSMVCPGDSIELCGPSISGASYIWRGPDDILYMTDCILVFDPGLYTLSVRDPISREWSEPCSLTVQTGRVNAPSITGATTTCSGTAVNWCGPSGNLEYAWSGPNGFVATTMCATVGDAGNYTLRVRPLPNGCWGDGSVQSLTVNICPPPGPLPGPGNNCPRPAWWWALQCSGWDRRHTRISGSQLAAVASCVDDHSTALSWSDDASGFTRTVRHEHRTLRHRARRQFAAAWANVCAGQMNLNPPSGLPVALDPSTPLDASLGGGTVGSWLTFADGELARLEGRSEHSQSARESYRKLIRTGWHINHGRGIGSTCQSDLRADAQMAVEEGMAASEAGLEALPSELVEGEGSLSMGSFEPNPFRTQTSMAFAVSTTSTVDVTIGVYDVSGRLIRELVRGPHAPGQYVARWDGTSTDGAAVRSGLYFIRGRVGAEQVQSRVPLIR